MKDTRAQEAVIDFIAAHIIFVAIIYMERTTITDMFLSGQAFNFFVVYVIFLVALMIYLVVRYRK